MAADEADSPGEWKMKQASGAHSSAIGQFLRARRRERGITQAELAMYADVSYTLVNRIENGDMNVQAGSLNKLLNVFGYQVGPVPMDRSGEVSDA